MKNYTLTTAPAIEPATLGEALGYMRVDSGGEDDICAVFLGAGREYVEAMTGRALITQTWKMTAQGWGENGASFVWNYSNYWGGVPNNWTYSYYATAGQVYGTAAQAITLDRTPLISVTSVKYYPSDGSAQVTLVEGTDYRVDTTSEPGRIMPVEGTDWPSVADRPDAVQVVFVAGYGAAATSVPNELKVATLSLASWFYEQRNPAVIGSGVNALPHSLDAILARYRVRGQLA